MILQICLVRRYVLVMSLTHFRVNPHSIVASTSRTPCSKLKWNLKCLSVRLQTMWFSCSHLNFRFPAWFEQEFLDVQATIECGFTLKCVREMTRTYIQMHRTDKYSQILGRPVWINVWVFVYELSGCGFESSCMLRKSRNFIFTTLSLSGASQYGVIKSKNLPSNKWVKFHNQYFFQFLIHACFFMSLY